MRIVWRIAEALAALVFMVGSLAYVFGGLYIWMLVTIETVQTLGWLAGIVLVVSSFVGLVYFQDSVRLPWVWWSEVWQWTDRMIVHKQCRRAP